MCPFGCPGAGVDAYAQIAESVVPLAKPDVVLVAVLQGIDLKLADIGPTTNRLFQDKLDQAGRTRWPMVCRTLPGLREIIARRAAHSPRIQTAHQIRREWFAKAG